MWLPLLGMPVMMKLASYSYDLCQVSNQLRCLQCEHQPKNVGQLHVGATAAGIFDHKWKHSNNGDVSVYYTTWQSGLIQNKVRDNVCPWSRHLGGCK